MVIVQMEEEKQCNLRKKKSMVGILSDLLEINVSLGRTHFCSFFISYMCVAVFYVFVED